MNDSLRSYPDNALSKPREIRGARLVGVCRPLALFGCALALATSACPAIAAPRSITIYRQDAVIHDIRNLPLTKGLQRLSVGGLSPRLEGSSIRAAGGPHVHILQQTYRPANLSPENLLRAAVGQDVEIAHIDPDGKEMVRNAQLLAVSGNRGIVQSADKVETVGPGSPWRLVFNGIPDTLSAEPSVTWLIRSDKTGEIPLRMTYLANGVSWHSVANIVVGETGREAHLGIWAIVDNQSGIAYHDLKLKLISGDLHRTGPKPMPRNAALRTSLASGEAEERPLGDYHLYTVPFKVTLTDGETTQLRLLQRASVPVSIRHRVEIDTAAIENAGGRRAVPVRSILEIDNKAPALGVPLPAGLYRAYRTSKGDGAEFVGEAQLPYTAPTAWLHLPLGIAGDIVAQARETERRQTAEGYEASWKIKVRNTRDAPVHIDIAARFPPQAEVLATARHPSVPHAGMLRWKNVSIASGKTVKLTFNYRVTRTKSH